MSEALRMAPGKARAINNMDDEALERIADRLVEKMNLRVALTGRTMDIAQTAAYLGRTVSAVQHMVKRGTLPTTKLDGKVTIDRLLLDRLIEAKTA